MSLEKATQPQLKQAPKAESLPGSRLVLKASMLETELPEPAVPRALGVVLEALPRARGSTAASALRVVRAALASAQPVRAELERVELRLLALQDVGELAAWQLEATREV